MNFRTGILFTVCILAFSSSHAQTKEQNKQRRPSDSIKVIALLESIKQNLAIDPAKAIEFGNEAVALAGKDGFEKELALGFKMLGIANYYQGNNVDALNFYKQSLAVFTSLGDDVGISNLQNNIGAIYMSEGDDVKALSYFLQSLQKGEKTGDSLRTLSAMANVGAVYSHNDSTFTKAIYYDQKALPLAEALKANDAIGTISVNLGHIYAFRNEDSLAMFYYKKSLKAFGNSENSPSSYNALGALYLKKDNYALALFNHREAYAIATKLNGKPDIVQALQGLGRTYAKMNDNKAAIKYFLDAEAIAKEIDVKQDLMNGYRDMSIVYASMGDFKNALLFHQKYSDYKDTLVNESTSKQLATFQFEFDLQKKEGEITGLKKDNSLRQLELRRQRFAKNASIVGLILVFILAFFIYRNYRNKVKSNKILDKKNSEIEHLLLNIFPAEVANELQTTGKATPRHFENVSVLFTDFKGFTAIADKLTPEEVVEELNTCFMAFDNIVDKHNLEKIKTIGDSYMCAGNIPTYDKDHVCNIIKASLDMLRFMEQYNSDRISKNLPVWDIRIGVHVGPVVAGIVGTKKYAYDIWGSTVNVASRMESNGAPGLVNISAATYEQVKNDYTCNYRGKIYAKNVGDIDMYFVSPEQIKYENPPVVSRIEQPLQTKVL